MGDQPQDEATTAGPPRKSAEWQRNWQRKRRANPKNRDEERKAQRAQKRAWKRVAEAHADEYVTVLNEERFKEGLKAAAWPFGHRPPKGMKVAEGITDPVVQADCPHDQGLKKLPYGKFCNLCNLRIT